MRLSEHRAQFTRDLASLIETASDFGLVLAINETGRTRYQQAEYVRTGRSWTMNSDHLTPLAVDWVYYIRTPSTYLSPIWAGTRPEIQAAAKFWIDLDPDYNYWGYAEWQKDTPHMGRKTQVGHNLRSRIFAGYPEIGFA